MRRFSTMTIMLGLSLFGCGVSATPPKRDSAISNYWSCSSDEVYEPATDSCRAAPPPTMPANAIGTLEEWWCRDGYFKHLNGCVALFVPDHAYAKGDKWFCVDGFYKCEASCIPLDKRCVSSTHPDAGVADAIIRNCKLEWPENFSMQTHCIASQQKHRRAVESLE